MEARFEGYKDSYLEHNLVTNEGLWITDIGSMVPQHDRKQEQEEADQHRIENYIRENPQVTAFLAVDHTTAVMTYKILKKLNLDQEKELVFFDGVDEKNDASPIFTHVMQGEGEIGRTAVRYLIDRIRGREVPERTYIPYDIVRGKIEKSKTEDWNFIGRTSGLLFLYKETTCLNNKWYMTASEPQRCRNSNE